MTKTQVRAQLALATTSVGLAVLLSGPASTFGLGSGLPIVGGSDPVNQVTSTVQGVVGTTQQTVATTVSSVESTVPATTQAAAPQEPAPPPVQTTVQTVSAAPQQAVSRVAEPVKKQMAAVARARTPSRLAAAPAPSVKTTARAVTETVRRTVRETTLPRGTPSAASDAAAAPMPQCVDVPLLGLLPGGSQVKALLTMVCDATGSLLLPGRVSADPSAGAGLGGLLGTTSSVPARQGRGRSALADVLRLGGASRRAGPITEQTANAASVIGATGAATSARAGGLPFIDAVNARQAPVPFGSASAGKAGGQRRHHSFFASQSSGTTVLMGILILNLAILAGIAMWRMAVRWVLPRFA